MVGRNYEINRLLNSLKSNSSELIAVYGRRRVGKTFLIRNIYKEHIKFEVSGLYQGEKEQQLDIFFDELKKYLSDSWKKTDLNPGKMPSNYLKNTSMDCVERRRKSFSLMKCRGWIHTNPISECISVTFGIPIAKNVTI